MLTFTSCSTKSVSKYINTYVYKLHKIWFFSLLHIFAGNIADISARCGPKVALLKCDTIASKIRLDWSL
jgi:hypothetical protein